MLAAVRSLFWNSNERRLRAGCRLIIQIAATAGLITLLHSQLRNVYPPKASEASSTEGLNQASWFAFANGLTMSVLFLTSFLASRFVDRRRFSSFGLSLNTVWFANLLRGIGLGAVLVAVIFVGYTIAGFTTIRFSDLDWSSLVRLQFGWLTTIACVAIAEEVMFRGYQFKNLCEGTSRLSPFLGILASLLVSASIFGLIHGANPSASPIACVSILCAGAMFCIGRMYTGSLAAPIGLHFAWNYGIGAFFGFPISGIVIPGTIFQTTTTKNAWTGGDFGPEASPFAIVAMLIGTTAFFFWPKTRAGFSESATKLRQFIPRNAGQESDQSPVV